MFRVQQKILNNFKLQLTRNFSTTKCPEFADVVIIGGGSAGCNTLYQLSKQNVNAVLLERAQLTAGTTWHTNGLVWRLRPNDVEIQLLATTRELLLELEAENSMNEGLWTQNGGLFISHSTQRTNEYRRIQSLGKCFGIESHILTAAESHQVFPLLDPKAFENALYSPGDGIVDATTMCTALARASSELRGQVIENCAVSELIVEENVLGSKEIRGVKTKYGTIKTNAVVNAAGVWGNDLLGQHDVHLPLVPMKHAYVISETIEGVRGSPNVRDHDYSTCFRVQGDAICMGGYETNPILLDNVPSDFSFGLYELDYSVFDTHIEGSVKICPTFGNAGIKSTICGPESFTPDHRPLMGPDPDISNLFHICGFNSAGMMLGGGCAKQLASWMIHNRPDLHMFAYDIRRFTPKQKKSYEWAVERSHESYATNYGIVFPNNSPLAGRNFITDPFHDVLVKNGAVMEEKSGFERPGYFIIDGTSPVQKYDWYGSYGNSKNKNSSYIEKLSGDLKFEFSDHHDLIGEECRSCRQDAVVFNLSSYCKVFLTGKEANEAAEWMFTANLKQDFNKAINTCALNDRGGVEAIMMISPLENGITELIDTNLNTYGFYCVSDGASNYHTITHMRETLLRKKIDAKIIDVTHELGVLSIQGPKSREIMSLLSDHDFSNQSLPLNSSASAKIKSPMGESYDVRVLHISYGGELGYELHIPKASCLAIYTALMQVGAPLGLKNAGFRALNSLTSEKGQHLWGSDVRSDDTPIEANLDFLCRQTGDYRGKTAITKQQQSGIHKRLVHLTMRENLPVWGLEAIYRNGKIVGHLRRGDFSYTLNCAIGQSYVQRVDKPIDLDFITSGKYQIEVMGKLYDIECHLQSPMADSKEF